MACDPPPFGGGSHENPHDFHVTPPPNGGSHMPGYDVVSWHVGPTGTVPLTCSFTRRTLWISLSYGTELPVVRYGAPCRTIRSSLSYDTELLVVRYGALCTLQHFVTDYLSHYMPPELPKYPNRIASQFTSGLSCFWCHLISLI